MLLTRIGIWPTLGRPNWQVALGPRLVLGRDPSCDLCLSDPAISAFHAEVAHQAPGLVVRDLGSKNGTFLKGSRVSEAALGPEEPLGVGGYILRLAPLELAQAPPQELEQALAPLADGPPDPDLVELARAWAGLRPELAEASRCLALACLRQADLSGAAVAADRARLLEPDNPRTRLVEALVAEAQGRLESASRFLEELAAGPQPPPGSQEALRRVGQKLEVYAKVKQLVDLQEGRGPAPAGQESVLSAGPFELHFIPEQHGELVLGAQAALVQAAERLRQVLGFDPARVQVRFEPEAPGQPWAAAIYDGAIRLSAPRAQPGDPYFIYVALTHEYVHLAVDHLSAGAAPAWLSEGLAQFLTQNPTPSDRRVMMKALSQEALLPLEVLAGDFGRLSEPALVDLAYAQSYSLVQFLVQWRGWPGLRGLLARLAGAGEPQQALGAALAEWGLDLDSLESAWLKWLS